MNLEVLQEVRDRIFTEQMHHDHDVVEMGDWLFARGDPECNTVGCIAGWAAVVTGKVGWKSFVGDTWVPVSEGPHVSDIGREMLELSMDEARFLFHVGNWPIRWEERYYSGVGEHRQSQTVVEFLDAILDGQIKLDDYGWHGDV